MESNLAIEAEKLSKTYLKGTLTPFGKQVGDLLRGKTKQKRETTTALDDISFRLEKGTTLGIIGKNGSGKSTLLKVLSGVTTPNSGKVKLRGKRLSILEIGTGFHPDFTGRENVYLNGAINGLRRPEIDAIFDQIVEFSEIGEFIDTPVKNYSSGMYLRLAFSIIAFLDADILLLDEVIAVGDASFQIKCMEKVRELAGKGRTVVIASHSTNELLSVCNQVMFLEGGRIKMIGPPMQVIGEYMREAASEAILGVTTRSDSLDGPLNHYAFSDGDREKSDFIKLREIGIQAKGKALDAPMVMGEELLLQVRVEVVRKNPEQGLVFQLNDRFYNQVSTFTPNLLRKEGPPISFREPGSYLLHCVFPRNLLKNGEYTLSIGLQEGNEFLFGWQNIISFQVTPPDLGENEQWYSRAPVIIGPVFQFSIEEE